MPRTLSYASTLQLFVASLDRADMALVEQFSGDFTPEMTPTEEMRFRHLGFRYERFLEALHLLDADTEGEREGVAPLLGTGDFVDLLAGFRPLITYDQALAADSRRLRARY